MRFHLPQISVLSLITIAAWHRILAQSLMGEGFQYFGDVYSITSLDSLLQTLFTRYDAGALLLFNLFKATFKDNILLYQLFLFCSILLIAVLFYIMAYKITKKKAIALGASLLFSISFSGYEMFAIGNYQFFVQRALPFLLLFPSFTFFHSFVTERKISHYILSFLLFSMSYILANFSLFFLFFFVCYLASLIPINRVSIKAIFHYIVILVPFLLISIFFFHMGILGKHSKLELIKELSTFVVSQKSEIQDGMLRQLAVLTIPERIIYFFQDLLNQNEEEITKNLQIPVLMIYIFSFFLVARNKKKLNVYILCSLLFMPFVFFFNLYLRWDEVLTIQNGSRYLYVPSIGFSIFWGIVLFSNRKMVPFSFVLLLFLILSNITDIWNSIDRDYYKHKASFESIAYIKNISPNLDENSIVIVPSVLSYHGAIFCQLFYGSRNSEFYPFFSDWKTQIKRSLNSKKDIVLEYDFAKEKVVNMTSEL